MFDHMYVRRVECPNCGKAFKDDCGDIFCSESCEREYIKEMEEQENEENE